MRWTYSSQKLMAIICAASIGGCALPIEPKYDREALKAKGALARAPTVKDVRNISDAWADELNEAVRSRSKQDLLASEVLFYGTVLFSAAALQGSPLSNGWRQARNVGVGAAAGSELLRSHYQPNEQALAFKRASSLMRCMMESLQSIPEEDEYVALFDQTDKALINAALTVAPKDIDALYNDVPRQTLHFIEQVVIPRLQADLKVITLGAPSKAEFTAILDKYKADKDSGDKATKSLAPSALASGRMKAFMNNPGLTQEATNLRQKAVVSALTSFGSELLLCKPTS